MKRRLGFLAALALALGLAACTDAPSGHAGCGSKGGSCCKTKEGDPKPACCSKDAAAGEHQH